MFGNMKKHRRHLIKVNNCSVFIATLITFHADIPFVQSEGVAASCKQVTREGSDSQDEGWPPLPAACHLETC